MHDAEGFRDEGFFFWQVRKTNQMGKIIELQAPDPINSKFGSFIHFQ
jgi:hypothetical protein